MLGQVKIDYKFLSDLEGGCRTDGYVPAAGDSKSGVTIATGFDLGQCSADDLNALGLPLSLNALLQPYLGKKTVDAQAALKKAPLKITPAQAADIDLRVKKNHTKEIMARYDFSAGGVKFVDLPPQAQTVIMSVSFQYGVNLAKRTPKFWKAAIKQDWDECIKILDNFGDDYPTRRRKEADLLEAIA